jgi:hypothetical protein
MTMSNEPMYIVYQKGDEKYAFTFDESSRMALYVKLVEFARNPDLSFDFGDVAKIRDELHKYQGVKVVTKKPIVTNRISKHLKRGEQ